MDYTETLYKRLGGYKGLIIETHLDDVTIPGGARALREVVEHPGGVAVLPVDEEGFAYCVRQFRYPMGEHVLEAPAGKLEYGEEPFECAVRELSEETGLVAREFTYLGEIYPSPGYCREKLYIYLARGLTQGAAHPDQNEFLDVEKIHIDELIRLVMDNNIRDAKTVVAILKAKAILSQ
ncbi:MAG: NUDIX hydrolase [Oscillospiraceae bacterium]|jgi:ADP-ribose pyrophosphatase|nr:NUDIX hydrolase [Oscillospiraceae bacterium]